MAHGRNKYQSRENRARVRQLLLREWDPIGINGLGPADEYDAYADKAYVMLMDDRATAEQIAAYLLQIALEHMGLTDHGELAQRSKQVAHTLVSFRPDFAPGHLQEA